MTYADSRLAHLVRRVREAIARHPRLVAAAVVGMIVYLRWQDDPLVKSVGFIWLWTGLAAMVAADPDRAMVYRVLAGVFIVTSTAAAVAGAWFDPFGFGEGQESSGPDWEAAYTSYAAVLACSFLIIWPPFLFAHQLIRRRRGDPEAFTRFTCYLGLFAWLVFAWAVFLLLREWLPGLVKHV
ncbi:MAG: hypothetical protein R6X20_01960 [Phycisphaerae bacterium]